MLEEVRRREVDEAVSLDVDAVKWIVPRLGRFLQALRKDRQ